MEEFIFLSADLTSELHWLMEGCDESRRGWGCVVENWAREKQNKRLL